jgi:UTP:GlnB (protein PII) uridylyltransferase
VGSRTALWTSYSWAERVGPAFAYRLNRAHLATEPIMALAGLRTTFLARLKRLLALWSQPPAYAAVFGSSGRGTMRPDSDIDLLLVRSDGPDEAWDAQVDDLVSTVTAWTGNDLREHPGHALDGWPLSAD